MPVSPREFGEGAERDAMLASDRREGIAPWQTGGERIGKLASQILRPPAARRRAPPDGGRMRVSALIAARNRATAARRRSVTSSTASKAR